MSEGVDIMAVIEKLQMKFQFKYQGKYYYRIPISEHHATYIAISPNMDIVQVNMLDYIEIKQKQEAHTD